MDLDKLHNFIVSAKAATYVGDGEQTESSREDSHDLLYEERDFRYSDSYFGGSDFIGEEVVYYQNHPVWGMNYYGVVLKPEEITAAEAGKMIKASLSRMYAEDRFLGGWSYTEGDLLYHDSSEGDLSHFIGYEWIEKNGEKVYELFYHGGLIK